jgi:glycerophosphoryl diester phosphodiesterase
MRIRMMLIFSTLFSTAMAQNFYIAHRGASAEAPENTVASAKLAWEKGADAVEVDVHLASDNRIMVIHDNDTRRTCLGKNLTIKNTPSMVIRDLDAGSWKDMKYKGERIPWLEEIIATLPTGKMLVVEIKCGSEILPHLERIMGKSNKKQQLVFISFDWQTIVDIKKAFPENKAYWLSDSHQAALKKIPQIVTAGINGLDMQFGAINAELVKTAKENNLEVLAWTVDNPDEARVLMDLGITYFTTNRPDWLKQQLEK